MGVLPEYHRQGIGCTLLRLCAHSYVARGYRYLTVKTLADTVGSASYVKRARFILPADLNLWKFLKRFGMRKIPVYTS